MAQLGLNFLSDVFQKHGFKTTAQIRRIQSSELSSMQIPDEFHASILSRLQLLPESEAQNTKLQQIQTNTNQQVQTQLSQQSRHSREPRQLKQGTPESHYARQHLKTSSEQLYYLSQANPERLSQSHQVQQRALFDSHHPLQFRPDSLDYLQTASYHHDRQDIVTDSQPLQLSEADCLLPSQSRLLELQYLHERQVFANSLHVMLLSMNASDCR